MEFFRWLIIPGIEIYNRALRINNANNALSQYKEGFGRKAKVACIWYGFYTNALEKRSTIVDTVRLFGDLVYALAKCYDFTFGGNYLEPRTHCKRGQLTMETCMPTQKEILFDLYARFSKEDHQCQIGKLLNIENGCTTYRNLLNIDVRKYTSKVKEGAVKLSKALNKFVNDKEVPSCKNCSHIGDMLIAIEATKVANLYHTDNSFDVLCDVLKTKHTKFESIGKKANQKSGQFKDVSNVEEK